MQDKKPEPIAIAVVGVSAIFPGAQNAPEFWREIVSGKDLITEVPTSHWEIDDYFNKDPKAEDKTYCRRGSFLADIEFDPLEWGIPPQVIPSTDTAQLLALIAAKQVLNDTYDNHILGVDLSRASVILGVTASQELVVSMSGRLFRPIWVKAMRENGLPEDQIDKICDRICQHFPTWQENTFPGLLMNVVAGRIANRLNFGGTNCITDAACASSFSALSMAINELRLHQSDLVVVGGADTLSDIFAFMCFTKTPALSPTEDCRPFSSKSDGTLLAEGVGLFAIKRLEDAEKDGNKIYAVIRGIGTSSDGRAKSIYAPLSKGQAVAVQRAYEMAGYSPGAVDLYEAHGTGTKAGDIEEFKGMKEVFENAAKDKQWCALGTVKSQIGHAKGAAGTAGLFKIVMSLHHKILPPTLKVEMPNPELHIEDSPFYLNTKARPWIKRANELRRASVSSFGFGGTNFHITVEEYKGAGRKPQRFDLAQKQLILLSANNTEALKQRCIELKNEIADLADQFVTYYARQSYRSFRADEPLRLALIVENESSFQEKLEKVIAHLETNSTQAIVDRDIYFSQEAKKGKLAFLFAGQGSQYLHMGADLAMSFEASREIWDLTTEMDFESSTSLHEVVFPKPVFSTEENAQQRERLNNTLWTQPALSAVAFSQLALLNKLNLKPDCVAGHSFGELAALAYAGAFDFSTLLKIARKRGELMANSATSEKGGMLAIFQPIEKTLQLAKEWQLALVPASFNSPSELILSGSLDNITKAKQLCEEQDLSYKELPVSNAFHSPLMKAAASEFRTFLADLHFNNLELPVYSTSLAVPHQQEENQIKTTIAEQLETPIRFVETIKAMYEAGVRIFLEIGPHAVLNNLVKAILAGKDFEVISLDSKSEHGLSSLWRALGQLAVQGVSLNFEQLLSDFAIPEVPQTKESKKHKMLINGANIKPSIPPIESNQEEAAHAPQVNQPVSLQNEQEILQATTPISPVDTTQPLKRETPSLASQPNHSMLNLYEQIQKNITEAHEQYQKSTAQSHQAFLQMVGQTLETLHGLKPHNLTVEKPIEIITKPSQVSFEVSTPLPEKISVPPKAPVVETEVEEVPAAISEAKGPGLKPAIFAIISSETGYPEEMLSVEMDMEADLGIDSIKRVEILSALQEQFPKLPELAPTQLNSLKTLEQLIDFTNNLLTTDSGPGSEPATSKFSQPITNLAEQSADKNSALSEAILTIISSETGYPVDMLSMQMDMEADLGIDSIKRVEILSAIQEKIPGLPEFEPLKLNQLKTLQELQNFIAPDDNQQAAPAMPVMPENNKPIQIKSDTRRVQGRRPKPFIREELPGLRKGLTILVKDTQGISSHLLEKLKANGINAKEVDKAFAISEEIGTIIYLSGLDQFNSSSEAIKANIDAFEFAKSVATQFSSSGGNFIIVQNTGGEFGLTVENPIQAWSAGLVSLARTAALEWPKALVKAIDLEGYEHNEAEVIAELLCQELLSGGAEKEVGLGREGSRWTLEDYSLGYEPPTPLNLAEKAIVLVTGGARGVTSWCVQALASRYRLHFVLLGRTPIENEPDYCKTATTAIELKQKLYEHAKINDIALAPKALEQQVQKILANREIQQTLQAIQSQGSEASYYSVDILNAQGLQEIITEVIAKYGAIHGLIHGAGLLHDKLIAQKTREQFIEVFNLKVKGVSLLLEALTTQPLQLICLFSSVASRYGNQGQCDYAMANQVLNSVAAVEQKRRNNDCVVKSINWGPWEGGMVTAELQKHFHSQGVELLSRALGSDLFLEELTQKKPVTILLGSGLGSDLTTKTTNKKTIEEFFTISPESHSFLRSHYIKGNIVVPVCLIFEWFVQSIRKHYPQINKISYHGLKVVHGIRLHDFNEQKFMVSLNPDVPNNEQELYMELKTENEALSYSMSARINVESMAREKSSPIVLEEQATPWPWIIENCYEEGEEMKLFHGPDFHFVQSLNRYGEQTASAMLHGISTFPCWPAENWLTDPGLIDGAFQVALLFGWKFFKKMSIPMKINELIIYQNGLIKEPVICLLQHVFHDSYCARYNLVIMHQNAKIIMEINGLEMVAMP